MCFEDYLNKIDKKLLLQTILDIIYETEDYRSNPRRFAVRSLGVLTYSNPTFVQPSLRLLIYVCLYIILIINYYYYYIFR